jgi:hypothetical protein
MDFYKNNKEWIIPVTILIVGKTIDFVLPWLRSYAENKYLSYQERRISILITRYREIRKLKQKPVFSDKMPPPMKLLIYVTLLMILFVFLDNYITSILGNLYHLVCEFLFTAATVAMIYFSVQTFKEYANTIDVLTFNKYRIRAINRLMKLGGGPKEIFQIDKEIQLPNK